MSHAIFKRITLAWVPVACALLLSAAAAAQQGGDTCATAPDINGALPITVSGTTVGYNNDYDAVCPYADSRAPDVVYRFTPASNILVDLLLCAGMTDFDTKLYVYDSCPPAGGAPLACNDDACTSAAGHGYVSALFNFPMQAGQTYYIVIDGYDGDAGNYTLTMTPSFPVPGCPPDGTTLLSQAPALDDWTLAFSDSSGGVYVSTNPVRYESYQGLRGRIAGIRFWGLDFTYPGAPTWTWRTCAADTRPFTVTFYEDKDGTPNSTVCTYTLNIAGTVAERLGYPLYNLYEYRAILDPPCVLRKGWVSIVGSGTPNCWFVWMNSDEGDGASLSLSGTAWSSATTDLALCLTTDNVAVYGACCDDALHTCAESVALDDCRGRFIPGGSCASFNPPCGSVPGVCCASTGGCTMTTASACNAVPVCAGDLNCDGFVDFGDIGPFVLVLGSQDGYQSSYPNCHIENGDCNGDGVISFADINPFVGRLGSSCGAVWLGPDAACDQCPPRRIVAPNDLPLTVRGSTCGRRNTYDATCLGVYDGGADIVYELVVTGQPQDLNITLDPNHTPYSGMLLTDQFPSGEACIAMNTDPNGSPYGLGCQHLVPGTYYIMIDTWPAPACLSSFTLTIATCIPPTGRCCYGDPGQCAQVTQDECVALAGTWDPNLSCAAACPNRLREDCAHAGVIAGLPYSTTFDSGAMTADGPAAPCDKYGATGLMQNDAWWVWTATSDCLATATILGGTPDRVLVVRRDCATPAALYCADNDPPGSTALETVRFPAVAGTTYYFQAGFTGVHPGSGSGTFTLECSAGSGACCFPNGSCQALTGWSCLNQSGAYGGDGTDCATSACPQPTPGNTCADPVLVTLNSATMPFVDHNTTRGRGNDYTNTCLESYDSGEDIVYKLTVTETVVVTISLDPLGTPYTGLLLSRTCPPGDDCIVKDVGPGTNVRKVEFVVLVPGVYYVMVDSWLAPQGIPAFDLRIEVADTQVGACCVDASCTANVTLASCLALGGKWFRGQSCTGSLCQATAGSTCGNPIVLNMSTSSIQRSDTTCNRGNAYAGTMCLDLYDGGQEIVYALNVTGSARLVDIVLSSNAGSLMAMALADACPPAGGCIISHDMVSNVTLTPGTHYLMVDMWPYRVYPGSTTWTDCASFSLTIKTRAASAGAKVGEVAQ